MSSLHTLQLLSKAAVIAKEQRESFPAQEIVKKLQDIKYLSSQKKVPRLSLRKEIIHLENQLQGALGSEKREKDKESLAIAALKQQMVILKNKLRAVDGLELDKKVEHLSFLLAEHLAKKETAGDIAMAEAPSEEKEEQEAKEVDPVARAAMLQRRLDALKQGLGLQQEMNMKTPDEIQEIEEKIKMFEEHLEHFYEEHPETRPGGASAQEVRHKMLFPQEIVEEIKAAERELPLPPPPKMGKRE